MNTAYSDNPTSKIGQLLKQYRESIRLTQSYVAKQSGISSSMLSQIESSIVSPSISTLFAICSTMGMDMTYLMKALNKIDPVHVYNKEKRPKEDYKNAIFEKLIPKSDAPNGAQFLHLEIQPGQEISLRGQGIDITAMGYVIAGQVLVILEDKKDILLKKGDSILFRSLIPHTFRNTGKTLFRAVWSLTPICHDFPTK